MIIERSVDIKEACELIKVSFDEFVKFKETSDKTDDFEIFCDLAINKEYRRYRNMFGALVADDLD